MMERNSLAHRERGWPESLFWLLLLLFEGFLFTIPLFPSSDGPLHLYYSSIMWKLATHTSPLDAHFYVIRHLVQPYSFHYYLLTFLEHRLSADAAEKVFIGLIWATLALGFRALTRTLVPAARSAPLWIFPLLFGWPLGGGFLNYTFGAGLLLFALAFYYRLAADRHPLANLALLVLTLILLVLAHPIPLMLLICILGMDLVLRAWTTWRTARVFSLPAWELAALALACVAFLFPIFIADKAQVASSLRGDLRFHPLNLRYLLSGQHVAYFRQNGLFGRLYDVAIPAMLPASIFLAFRSGLGRRLRAAQLDPADRLLLAALFYLLGTLFFPDTMNGSALFAVRMWFMVWLLTTAVAAVTLRGQRTLKVSATAAVAFAFLCLGLAVAVVRPTAIRQRLLENAAIPSHARGIFIQQASGEEPGVTGTSYPAAFWEGARAFAAHDDILLNSPWLQLTILPLGENGRSGLLRDFSSGSASENPNHLSDYLQAHPRQRAEALARADFLLFSDPVSHPANPLHLAQATLGQDASQWQCAQQDFFAVCLKK